MTGIAAVDMGRLMDVTAYFVPRFKTYNVAFRLEDTEVSDLLFKAKAQLRRSGYALAVELTGPEVSRHAAVRQHPAFQAALESAMKQPKGSCPIYWVLDRCCIGRGANKTVWNKGYIDQLDAAIAQQRAEEDWNHSAAVAVQAAAAAGEVVVTKKFPPPPAAALHTPAAAVPWAGPTIPRDQPWKRQALQNTKKPAACAASALVTAAGATATIKSSTDLGLNILAPLAALGRHPGLGTQLLQQMAATSSSGMASGSVRGA